MTGPDAPIPVDSLRDPASLLDHPDVDAETTTEPIEADDFPDAAAWTDHVVVGVADDRGVLLYDDGHHGWTPPAFPLDDDEADADEDVLAVARREFEALTGTPVTIDGVLHARQRTFPVEDEGDDREASVWNVVLAATLDEQLPDDPESEVEDAAIAWRDGVPADASEVVAADVERIAATAPPAATGSERPAPTESLTDPEVLRDREDIEYVELTEANHFGQDEGVAGVAVVGLTNDDGALAFAAFEEVTILPHAVVEAGEDYATVAREAAADLLGVDVRLDDVVRVRRKTTPSGEGDSDAEGDDNDDVAYVVVFAASPTGDGVLPDAEDVPSCQAESTGWFERVPEDLQTEEMRADARLFLD